ncbi:HEXXH motif-containing putative peptide modification protein, partial [Frankia sp. AgKG'84/4]|uniref:aKG-HExxH-type peptide beta-hydroxylase n=1 Tax=Frankia sp. AgKG'84/4 TaxID=573490 RepID=UPI002029BB93
DPFRVGDALPAGVAAAASPAETARWDRLVAAAGALLAHAGPDLAAEVAGTLHTLVPLRPVAACQGSSATATDSLGAALLSPPSSPLALAASLVHESAHSRLEMVHDLAALVSEAAGHGDLYFSPWRPDPRPLAAVLQGTFAHARMAAFWAARWTRRSPAADPHAAYEFAWCRE